MVLAKEFLIFNLNSNWPFRERDDFVSQAFASTYGDDSYFRSFSLCPRKQLNEPGCRVVDSISRSGRRRLADRTPQIFCVPKSDIVEQGYDLSINRYKEVVHEAVDHRTPQAILDELESIEKEITQGMKQLRGMLK